MCIRDRRRVHGRSTLEDWPAGGHVQIKDLSVRYRPELELILKGISLEIHPGEHIGIVGRTGSGKSTLFLGLLRVLEAETGTILFDGVDISKIGLDDLRRRVTLIPQDAYLFEGTLRENLDPTSSSDDQSLTEALQKVSLYSLFATRGGLDAQISENGDNISVGERQLLTIARALLKKSRLVLMDEATAAIDIVTESTIQRVLKEAFAGCTILTIAHRLNTVAHSDRVLVLEEGRIVEFASPAELLANPDSHYSALVRETSVNVSN
eukprot:TRINITY_DN1785_c0_g1_i2.p1 TRINITY_DN1785_c0_g1~~TRINITY_DN1785_c0_g1_i2.p1  ORF type:complete len:266 (+),score=65.05 TRINITY_DN1785_c0_g1_i2:64-861(+)